MERAAEQVPPTVGQESQVPLPDELTIPLPAGYRVLSADEYDLGDQRFLSVAILYEDVRPESLVAHFDEVFRGYGAEDHIETVTDGSRTYQWSSMEPIRSVALTFIESADLAAIGISEQTPKR